jgi:hypothetical protein
MGSLHPTTVHSYLEKGKQSQSIMRAKLPFMTRLPKNRGITQAEEDKSLILRWIYSILNLRAGDNPIKQVSMFV